MCVCVCVVEDAHISYRIRIGACVHKRLDSNQTTVVCSRKKGSHPVLGQGKEEEGML